MNSLTRAIKRLKIRINQCSYVTVPAQRSRQKAGREWFIQRYGNLEELQFNENGKKPRITDPSEVLVRIIASSVNPIDVAMVKGYGVNFLNLARRTAREDEFPLVLGRDFVGEVVQRGMAVNDKNVEVGQVVWGVLPVHRQGCHRDHITVSKHYITEKPNNINDIDASGVLYAGLTAWSGIYVSGQLGGPLGAATPCGGGRNKSVLVLGASGGVGSLATQMLVAEGAFVTATCSTDAIPMVEGFGVRNAIDYKAPNSTQQIGMSGPFDLVLDCAGKGSDYAKELSCHFQSYVTFSSPLLRNVDESGIIAGNLKNITDIITTNISSIGSNKGLVKWGYFLPAPQGIEYLKRMMQESRINPITSTVLPFTKTDLAYKKVEEGHLRGKVIIDMTK